MTKTQKSEAANLDEAVKNPSTGAGLNGLFDEMQALMALMPGTILDSGKKLFTEEETEAMFDNMPL